MQLVFGIIIGLLILMALVTAHEFGHFIMARKNGVKVNEFGICFPPRLAAWIKKECEVIDKKTGEKVKKQKWVRLPKSEWGKPQDSLIFSINCLPIGGFCTMDGESDADTRKGTFGAASFWGKTKILFGGVLMNWLVAFVLLTILAFTGMPQFLNQQFTIGADEHMLSYQGVYVASVFADSPAAQAGIQAGDYISDIGEKDTEAEFLVPQDIIDYGNAHAGAVGLYYITNPQTDGRWVEIPLNPEGSEYTLGVQLGYSQASIRYTWSAPIVAAGTTLQLTGETFKSLGQLVWNLVSGVFRQLSPSAEIREQGQAAIGQVGDSVSGPVGIIGVIFPTFASTGAANLAFLTAIVSISLACMNVLPIPALDGGRWLLIAIYKLRKKKLTKETEEKIVSRAFTVLLALIAIITILDIIKLF